MCRVDEPTSAGTDDLRPAAARRTRPSARVVLVDARDRILLARLVDDGAIEVGGDSPAPTYWVTLGGGVEPGETLEAAARREVFEEAGITAFTLGPELHLRRFDLVLRGEPILAEEHYFAGWLTDADPTLEHLDPLELGVLVEHRWWTHAELVHADRSEVVYPRSIARLVVDAIVARQEATPER